tara:strand:+ start:1032 stop:1349 length:318 start_codon:yes stop_codon:yes gene_type:complete
LVETKVTCVANVESCVVAALSYFVDFDASRVTFEVAASQTKTTKFVGSFVAAFAFVGFDGTDLPTSVAHTHRTSSALFVGSARLAILFLFENGVGFVPCIRLLRG